MKAEKTITPIFSIFGIVGLIMLVGGGAFLLHGYRYQNNADPVDAIITAIETYRDNDGDTHHTAFASYTYEGESYEVELNTYSADMREGAPYTLYCTPDNPGNPVSATSEYIMGGFLLFMGIIFFLIGFIPFVNAIRQKAKQNKLLQNGLTLQATVEYSDYDTSFSVNGRHPFVIYCTYEDIYKNVTYRFKSKHIWTDPSEVFPDGSTIDVLVDPTDYSKYYVNAEEKISERIIDYT